MSTPQSPRPPPQPTPTTNPKKVIRSKKGKAMSDTTNETLNEILTVLKEIQSALTADKETTADKFAAAFSQAQGE